MRRFIAFVLIVALLGVQVCFASDYDVMPCYEIARNVNTTLTISTSGLATVKVYAIAPSGAIIQATTHLEKYVNGNWEQVDLGITPNYWYDTGTMALSKSHALSLSSAGQYRAYTTYVITYQGSTETIIKTATAIYTG